MKHNYKDKANLVIMSFDGIHYWGSLLIGDNVVKVKGPVTDELVVSSDGLDRLLFVWARILRIKVKAFVTKDEVREEARKILRNKYPVVKYMTEQDDTESLLNFNRKPVEFLDASKEIEVYDAYSEEP